MAPAAVVSLLSGLYLYHALHGGLQSRAEAALAIGAFSAVLSFFVGAIGRREPSRQPARLDSLAAPSAADLKEIERLDRRVMWTGWATSALLLLSGATMAASRYL